MRRGLDTIRNIGIIAHIDAGKTTVTERMLFTSGAKHRAGEVDKGTTTTDSDVEEQERGITIYAACVTFEWKDVHVNLLDTPGHVDFTAEVERCLRVLDGAVVVFSAREGVEAQSETVWRQADKYRVPRIAFINKLDREGADFDAVFEEMSKRLNANPIAIQIPVGQGPPHVANPFRGVIDLIEMKMLTFPKEGEGREVVVHEIPEDFEADAAIWRDAMLEKLYNFSNELTELALLEQPIPAALIRKVLRDATLKMALQPVLCGAALQAVGIPPLLDAVEYYLPSPSDMPPIEGEVPDKKKKQTVREKRKPDLKEPFCGIVFKVLPAKTGDISWVRVYSGELEQNSRVLNPGKDIKENVAQLWLIHATKKEQQVEAAGAGDIVGVIGLRQSITGDTLCDTRNPILLEQIQFPETVISMAVEPESTTERKKLGETLDMLKRQDPTLQVVMGETGQTLIRGMGELHLEIVKNRLLRDFNLNVKFHKPQVSYRESIARTVEVVGECHRQIAGQSLFAKVRLRLEPMPDSTMGVVLLNECPFESLPEPLVTAAMEELKLCGEGGGIIAGFPLMKLRIRFLGGEWNPETSDERAFRIAANDAFQQGLAQGRQGVARTDHEAGHHHSGRLPGRLRGRPATAPRDHRQDRKPRPSHCD